MKINKLYFGLLAMASLVMASCSSSDDDYEWAKASGAQVYFHNAQETTIEVSKSESSFDIPIYRVDTNGDVSVPLTFTADEGNVFDVPSSINFKSGESKASITVTYNPDDVNYGTYVGGTINIGGEGYATEYGQAALTFKAGATEWIDFTTNKSIGSYREDMVSTFYGVDNLVYDVKIQKSSVNEGMYRMVNPYGVAYPYNEPGDYDDSQDHYWVINATDPDHVYFETFYTGMDWGNGEFVFTSLAALRLGQGQDLATLQTEHPEYFGTLVDGIITMPASSMLAGMTEYNDFGLYYANSNGMLAVALPGSVIADYSIEAAYQGRYTDVDDNDYAQIGLTFGADVASVKYALVAQPADVNEVVAGIMDGSIEAGEATKAGSVQAAYDDTGKYYFVMVIYNKAGEAVGADAVELKLQSSKDGSEQFEDIAVGTFTIGAKDQSAIFSQTGEPWGLLFKEAFTQESILSQSTSNPAHFKLTPYLDEEGAYPLDFTMEEDGTLVVDEIETGINTNAGMLMASDGVTYFGIDSNNGIFLANNGYASTYDKANSTFNFNIIYTATDGAYGFELETFEVTTWAEAAALKQAMKKAMAVKANNKKHMKATRHFVRKINSDAKRF